MNFGFSNNNPSSSGGWLGFGNSRRNDGTASPGATSPAAPVGGAGSPNAFAGDETSFAASYQETSPLYNPSLLPRSEPSDAAPLFGLSPNPIGTWGWQPPTAESDNRQSSPLGRYATAMSPELSTDNISNARPVADQDSVSHPIDQQQDENLGEDENPPSRDIGGSVAKDANNEIVQEQDAINQGKSDERVEEVPEPEKQADVAEASRESSERMGSESSRVQDVTGAPVIQAHSEPSTSSTAPQALAGEPVEETADGRKSSTSQVSEESSPDEEIPHSVQPASEKRRRRTAAELLREATEEVTKDIDVTRKRISKILESPALNPAPTSTKRARRSMPARVGAQTPAKRGRPRKSDVLPTTATTATPQSASKRGRPRKSDVAVFAPASVSRGRPRKVIGAAETPKRRGRPPKNAAQPSSANPVESSTKASSRSVRARAVPSPAKRGRPAKKTATSVSESSATKATGTKTATTRGRRAAAKPDDKPTTEVAEPPKRRGRPPKKASPEAKEPATKATATKATTKKRGRGASTSEAAPAAATTRRGRSVKAEPTETKEPPATKKRGRAKQADAEAAATAESDPPAKRQRTSRQAQDKPAPAAPVKKTGRGAAKATEKTTQEAPVDEPKTGTRGRGAVKDTSNEEVAEAPKTKTRGRGAAKKTVDESATPDAEVDAPSTRPQRGAAKTDAQPTEASAPVSRTRAAKSGKGEIAASKASTDKASKAKKGKGAAPTGVEKKKAPAKAATKAKAVKDTATTAAPTRRSTRSRG